MVSVSVQTPAIGVSGLFTVAALIASIASIA
jgi:hypothetical protein